MSNVYVDEDGQVQSRATTTVHEDPRSAKVTYRNESGAKFSVIVRQRPNPIGFRATLPGSGKK
jgi:hypothetical protein